MLESINQIKQLDTYVEDIAEFGFSRDNIVVEHRANNPRRDFLFVNRKQCKHIPSTPKDMIQMCNTLASLVQQRIAYDAKVVIVAFAETATAIGNLLADRLPQCSCVIQTTREIVEGASVAFEFKEEHSHAIDQRIYSSSLLSSCYDYILLVDDEITTGKTAINFISSLEEYCFTKTGNNLKQRFGVASICNWQSETDRALFRSRNVDLFYLLSGKVRDIHQKMQIPRVSFDAKIVGPSPKNVIALEVDEAVTERLEHAPNRDLSSVMSALNCLKIRGSIRVIGTEEFMYIPIRVAEYLERLGHQVICHSTTRSPIDVISHEAVGIHSSIPLPSVYDSSRRTYLYDFREFTDVAIFITDGLVDNAMLRYLKSILSCNTLIALHVREGICNS